MRLIAAAVIAACCSGPACAMNWEGHDDYWMMDMPHALDFRAAVGAAPPKPDLRPCVPPDQIGKVPENVYDQVPLRHQACSEPADEAVPVR